MHIPADNEIYSATPKNLDRSEVLSLICAVEFHLAEIELEIPLDQGFALRISNYLEVVKHLGIADIGNQTFLEKPQRAEVIVRCWEAIKIWDEFGTNFLEERF